MNATTVAIDLAKDVFGLAFADSGFRVVERKRVRRAALTGVFENRVPLHIVMEACGSAHYWARRFERLGHRVTLLPAHDVRPYVRRNKTDRTDAAGMLEAWLRRELHFMASASVPGTPKPITMLAVIGRLNEWLCPADSMMARAHDAHHKAEYTTAADLALSRSASSGKATWFRELLTRNPLHRSH